MVYSVRGEYSRVILMLMQLEVVKRFSDVVKVAFYSRVNNAFVCRCLAC